MSRIDPLLPLNWLVPAARLTVLAASPSALRVAGPNLSASSQKTKRTPRGAVDNGTKPTFTASDIGIPPDLGCRRVAKPAGNAAFNRGQWVREALARYYGLPVAALPSTVAGKPRQVIY